MLVLTRRFDESIVIGSGENKIVVTVLSVQSGNVRLGIEAPRGITVHREEVYKRIQKNLCNKISIKVEYK